MGCVSKLGVAEEGSYHLTAGGRLRRHGAHPKVEAAPCAGLPGLQSPRPGRAPVSGVVPAVQDASISSIFHLKNLYASYFPFSGKPTVLDFFGL